MLFIAFFSIELKTTFSLYWREFQYNTLCVLGTKLDTISLPFSWCAKFRVVTKISSCWVNTTSRQRIKQLVVWSFLLFYFSSIFLWKYPGATFTVAGGNPLPPPLKEALCFDKALAIEYLYVSLTEVLFSLCRLPTRVVC